MSIGVERQADLAVAVSRGLRGLAVVLLAVVVAACAARAGNSPDVVPATISGLTISPVNGLIIGGSYQLVATAALSNGTTQDVSGQVTWTSSNRTIGLVSLTGMLSVLAAGEVEVRAAYRSVATTRTLVIPLTAPLTCGVERWAVKTLSDVDAGRVEMNLVQAVTIKELNDLPVHCNGLPAARTFPPEFQTYEVTGRVLLLRTEDDRDYHLVLADPDDATATIVTEIVDVACHGAASSPFRTALGTARAQLEAILGGRSLASLNGTLLRVRGAGFYDFNHGQTGRSRSCMELHPVLSVETVK